MKNMLFIWKLNYDFNRNYKIIFIFIDNYNFIKIFKKKKWFNMLTKKLILVYTSNSLWQTICWTMNNKF